MMQDILQQLAGGTTGMPAEQLHGHVDTMVRQAPQDHVQGAVGEALQALGPLGFGQSVAQAAQGMGPQQQQGLVGLLGQAIEGGGGSLPGALGALGLGGGASTGSFTPGALGSLATYALQNHGGALSSVLGNQTSSGGSSVLRLLGNPMVEQVGMKLAQRLLSSQGL